MDSWDSFTPSPDMKLEASPAESFLSVPGEMYPSLFASATSTLNPLQIMSPSPDMKAEADAETPAPLATVPEDRATESPAPAGDKKPTKKRKSWGQVLPEPKTNLPPRKRAKTEDEKEQRRVERVLRNRRAAQSSRERKRQEVEALEKRNKELENFLEEARQTNMMLLQQLKEARGGAGIMSRPTAIDSLRPNPVTFSQPLFGSQDGHASLVEQGNPALNSLFMSSESGKTVNPASLSPALSPVPDQAAEAAEPATTAAAPAAEPSATEQTSPDMTQHPAEVLCSDLQCQSAEVSRSWTASQQPLSPALALYCQLTLLLASTSTMISICRRPLTQIAMSLKAGFSLPPTLSILNTIIWLVTQSSPSRRTRTSSTSTTTSTTRRHTSPLAATPSSASQPTRRPSTLRLKLLRKILTCSPILARPLLDATMEVMRLVRSEETLDLDRVTRDDGSNAGPLTGNVLLDGRWLPGAALPSTEVLLTLAWALKVELRRTSNREGPTPTSTMIASRPGVSSSVVLPKTTTKELYTLKTKKRARVDLDEEAFLRAVAGAGKRRRRSGPQD